MPEESLKMHPAPLLALVVPCYNEQEILPATMQTLSRMLEECKDNEIIKNDSYVLYVDDGSRDQTWNLLEEKHINDKYCHAIKFAGNAGHQNAVWAGMAQARAWDADCIISLDADLQDDTRIIPQMVEEYCKGNDIVYGVRNNRETDTTFKRVTAHLFYAFMRWLNVSVIPDHADYRLVSRPVLDALEGYSEQNLFLRGLFPTIGFKSSKVFYKRLSRKAGESKYPLRKMLSFAWRGITSCSVAPLRVAGLMSLICMLLAFIMCIVSLFKYATGDTIQGWTSLIIVSLLLGGVQLFCLAVMGEYIAKIFTEVRTDRKSVV